MVRVGSGSSFDLKKLGSQPGYSAHQQLSHMVLGEYYQQSMHMKVGCRNMTPILSVLSDTISSEILTYTEDLTNLTLFKDAVNRIFENIQRDPLFYFKGRKSSDNANCSSRSLKFPCQEDGLINNNFAKSHMRRVRKLLNYE